MVEPATRVVLLTSELALLGNHFQTLLYFMRAVLLSGCAGVRGRCLRRSYPMEIRNA